MSVQLKPIHRNTETTWSQKAKNVDAIVTVFISHTVFNLANTYIQQKYEVCTSVGCVTLMCIRPLFHLWNGNEYYKVLILHLRSPVICFFVVVANEGDTFAVFLSPTCMQLCTCGLHPDRFKKNLDPFLRGLHLCWLDCIVQQLQICWQHLHDVDLWLPLVVKCSWGHFEHSELFITLKRPVWHVTWSINLPLQDGHTVFTKGWTCSATMLR